MKVTYTNTKLEIVPNIVTDPKKMIIEYLQRLDLTQFVPYDSDKNERIPSKSSIVYSSYSDSEEVIEFGEYNINLEIHAIYFVYMDGEHIFKNLYCKGDVTNADDDIFMSEQEIQPHLNTI